MHKPKKNYTKTDDAEYLYIVIPTYNLIDTAAIIKKHQKVYGKTSEIIMAILLVLLVIGLRLNLK